MASTILRRGLAGVAAVVPSPARSWSGGGVDGCRGLGRNGRRPLAAPRRRRGGGRRGGDVGVGGGVAAGSGVAAGEGGSAAAAASGTVATAGARRPHGDPDAGADGDERDGHGHAGEYPRGRRCRGRVPARVAAGSESCGAAKPPAVEDGAGETSGWLTLVAELGSAVATPDAVSITVCGPTAGSMPDRDDEPTATRRVPESRRRRCRSARRSAAVWYRIVAILLERLGDDADRVPAAIERVEAARPAPDRD